MAWQASLKTGFITLVKLLFLRLLPVGLIIVAAWYSFLQLVAKPPIDTTSALIMVWASVILLAFAFFPQIFDRVKKLKLKDFEIELQEAVSKSATETEDYISPSELGDEYIFTEKGDWMNLQFIMEEASQQPNKPVLLVANVRDDGRISVTMLFLYLFFLDLVSRHTVVLFFSSESHPTQISDIRKESLLGVISGKKVLQTLLRRFPRFKRIFVIFGNPNVPEDFFEGGSRTAPSEHSLRSWYGYLQEGLSGIQPRRRDRLSRADVNSWFKDDLSTKTISMNMSPTDIQIIREALGRNDEYLISLNGDHLDSIIVSCRLSNSFARKVLSEVEMKSKP